MATAESDDETMEQSASPDEDAASAYRGLTESTSRRRILRAGPQRGELPAAANSMEPITVPGETVDMEIVRVRQSQPALESGLPQGVESDSVPPRTDLLALHLPGPPRMPDIDLLGQPRGEGRGRQRGASLLDAAPSLHAEPRAQRKAGSWLLVTGLAALTTVIAAAAVVALRDDHPPLDKPLGQASSAPEVRAEEPELSGFARYVAEDAAKQRAAERAAAERVAAERAAAERAAAEQRAAKSGPHPAARPAVAKRVAPPAQKLAPAAAVVAPDLPANPYAAP